MRAEAGACSPSCTSGQTGIRDMHVQRRLAALLAADVAGYSRLMRLDEARAALTQAHQILPEMSADKYTTHASKIAHPRLIEQVVAGLERIAVAS